jgi:hypothetical protein
MKTSNQFKPMNDLNEAIKILSLRSANHGVCQRIIDNHGNILARVEGDDQAAREVTALFVGAPDLLAALVLFLAVPDNRCGHRTFRSGCRCCIGKAAIAKAKGNQ